MTPSGALLTDLYELTMMQAYLEQGMLGTAVFEFFVRKLPAQRSFLVAAGLEQVLEYLDTVRFTDDERAYLAGLGRFTPSFLDALRDFRFTGDVDAMPEGTVFFPDEPILRIVAPMPEAQLVESRVMNLLHYQTMVASKAARCVITAPGRTLVDFGFRRAHGAEAGVLSARASWLAGFTGTATAEAGRLFGMPVYGTMAHSYVQAHEDEVRAFECFARSQPHHALLLIDTYDTVRAAHRVVALATRLAREGIPISGVRLDSGDLGDLARQVRGIFDAAGLPGITIFASGNVDEFKLRDLVSQGAPIDGFGVGTRMNTSADWPYLDCAYKLQEYDGRPRRKRSPEKATWPGRKQVWRRRDAECRFAGDTLGLVTEHAEGEPLLAPVMRSGRRLGAAEPLAGARERARLQLAGLPDWLRGLDEQPDYDVTVTAGVRELAADVDRAT
ncbi:MAG: nicotinate phosphoribosyltransferase [Acidobacteria bacterium]|nr:nicotinate phosphoribosyltransferase [Acidobacteriota bacterium]